MKLERFLKCIDGRRKLSDDEDLKPFEDKVGFRFPTRYRKFLLSCNGGHVGGLVWFTKEQAQGETLEVGINTIGGINRRHGNLDREIKSYAKFLPKSLVWIMGDPFGNAICIGVRGKDKGRIYFWDHEFESTVEYDPWEHTTLIAENFDEFVAGLELDDDDE